MYKTYTQEFLESLKANMVKIPQKVHCGARPDFCPITEHHMHVIEKMYPDWPDDLDCPLIGCTKCGYPIA